ncbi:MAG: polysulfide reductase NrfD [Chloroflexi bacterium]|nr:polysulfide reductase NrfD [Chloroflexota bacterium]
MDTIIRRRTQQRLAEELLRPLFRTGPIFYLTVGILLIPVLWFLYVWFIQLTQGLGVTGLRTPSGAAWGMYIVNFVFYVGIAHGGIAVAAAIRLLKLKGYEPIGRIGEVLTVVSISMAGLSISLDMGRPDRLFNIILYWPQRIGSSSLSWDVTVIILYFTMSALYLWLTMRHDLAECAERFPNRAWLYRPFLIGYRPGEKAKIDRMTWWLSIAIVFLIVMLSGGVVPWIFGLLPSRPGWFGALAGPYFLTAAISSAIAGVIVVSSIVRRVFHWDAFIRPQIFRGLGIFLGIGTMFYLYMILAEQLTMRYAAPIGEFLISEMMLTGEFAPLFWPMLVFGFFLPALFLIVQAFNPKWFSVGRTTAIAVVILIAFWVKRFLIVVPSLLRPLLPFPEGSYQVTWVEWSVTAGVLAMAILMFIAFVKLFPMVEVSEE